MNLVGRILERVGDVVRLLTSPTPEPTPRPLVPEVTRKVLPDGWPPYYGRQALEDGRFVVTVKCAVTGRVEATSLPRWEREEDCRADAWERHEYDPRPELADE